MTRSSLSPADEEPGSEGIGEAAMSEASKGKPSGRPPHPATIVQEKAPPAGASRSLPPHPATLAQRKAVPPLPLAAHRPPHPATVGLRIVQAVGGVKSPLPHPATTAQRKPAPLPLDARRPPHPAAVPAGPSLRDRAVQRSTRGEQEEPEESAPSGPAKVPTTARIRDAVRKADELVDKAVRLGQTIVEPDAIGELYGYLRWVGKAPDDEIADRWQDTVKAWRSTFEGLKAFVDTREAESAAKTQAADLARTQREKTDAGNRRKAEELAEQRRREEQAEADRQKKKKRIEQGLAAQFAGQADQIERDSLTVCKSWDEATTRVAFGMSSVGNHSPFQAFYRDDGGHIELTTHARAYATQLEPLRHALDGATQHETWDVYVCAEVDAAVQLLLAGATLAQIRSFATNSSFQYKPRCGNCSQWAKELVL